MFHSIETRKLDIFTCPLVPGIVPDNFLLVNSDRLYQIDLSSNTFLDIGEQLEDDIIYNPIDKDIYSTNRDGAIIRISLNGTVRQTFGKISKSLHLSTY